MQIKVLIPLLILVMLVSNAAAGFDDGLDFFARDEPTPVEDPIDDQVPQVPPDSDHQVSDYTKKDWIAGGFETGFENICIKLADTLSSLWENSLVKHKMDENGKVVDEYGNVRGGIFVGVTENVEPDKIGPVADFEEKSKIDWYWLILVWLFGYTFSVRLQKSKNEVFQNALNNYNLSDSRFILSFLLAVASYFSPYAVILYVELMSQVAKIFMLPVMDYIEPGLENGYMYLMMVIGEGLVGGPFLIRQWVITAVYATSRLLVILYVYGWKREWLISVYEWFKKIVEIQPVCVAVASFCLMNIKWFGMQNIAAPYLVMFILIFWVLKNFMFGGVLDKHAKRLWYAMVLKR